MSNTAQLMVTLRKLGRGETDSAYIAKRLAVGVERNTLPEDVIGTLVNMSPNSITGLVHRMTANQVTMYDLPRQIVFTLAQKFAHRPKGPRALQL